MYKTIVQFLFNIELSSRVVGKGFSIVHGQGIVIRANSVIGDNVTIKHNVTIGDDIDFEKNLSLKGSIVADNCILSPGTALIGVELSEGTIVGANSTVTKDFF